MTKTVSHKENPGSQLCGHGESLAYSGPQEVSSVPLRRWGWRREHTLFFQQHTYFVLLILILQPPNPKIPGTQQRLDSNFVGEGGGQFLYSCLLSCLCLPVSPRHTFPLTSLRTPLPGSRAPALYLNLFDVAEVKVLWTSLCQKSQPGPAQKWSPTL